MSLGYSISLGLFLGMLSFAVFLNRLGSCGEKTRFLSHSTITLFALISSVAFSEYFNATILEVATSSFTANATAGLLVFATAFFLMVTLRYVIREIIGGLLFVLLVCLAAVGLSSEAWWVFWWALLSLSGMFYAIVVIPVSIAILCAYLYSTWRRGRVAKESLARTER